MKPNTRLWAGILACLLMSASAGAAENREPEEAGPEKPPITPKLTEGSLLAHTMPELTVYGVADIAPSVPVVTRFGAAYNVVTEEMISRQNSLDFYDALRNVPGVSFLKRTVIGGQTSHSLYMRGRGASHPSPDLNITFDGVPRSGVLYGQALVDGLPVYALGGMEVYKSPQPTRFGSGYGMIDFVPKYMTQEGFEVKTGVQGGSFGTFAENLGVGAKQGRFDIYAAQSWIYSSGHADHTTALQASYYANLGVALSDEWSVRAMGNRVHADTQSPLNPLRNYPGQDRTWRNDDHYETDTSLGTLSLNNDYESAHGFLKGYYNKTRFHLRGEGGGDTTSRQTNKLYGLRGRETFNIWEGSELVAGFDLDVSDLKNEQFVHADSLGNRTWIFPKQTLFSPYFGISQLFGDEDAFHITPSAGFRIYDSDVFADKTAPQAGLVLGYGAAKLNFNYARGVNYPSPVVLQNYLTDYRNDPARGYTGLSLNGVDTSAIKPEVVDHYEVGLSHSLPDFLNLQVNATYFHDKGRDRTRAYMFGPRQFPPGPGFFNSSIDRYTIDGLELGASLNPVDDLELFAGATLLKVKAKHETGEDNHMPYTPSFTLQTGFRWKFLDRFVLNGDYQHIHNMYAGTYARTLPPMPGAQSGPLELGDTDRLPDINLVNLKLDYLFDRDVIHLKEGKLFLSITNLLNESYAYDMAVAGDVRGLYDMPGTGFMFGMEFSF